MCFGSIPCERATLTWDLPCYPNTYSRVRWLFGTSMRSFKAVYVFLLSPASLGCPGGASRVVRGQSHAGKLDRRMHRLLFWLQTQGKSLLSPLLICDLSLFYFFQLSIVFSKCPVFLSCFCLPLFFWDRFQQRSKISPFSFALSAMINLLIAVSPNKWCHIQCDWPLCTLGLSLAAKGPLRILNLKYEPWYFRLLILRGS